MTDATTKAVSEYRLPIAYSQGFAQIRVFALADPDDVGPLAVPALRNKADPDLIFAESAANANEGTELYRAD
ncbi:hypothetical protein [Hyphomicrobium sp. LHD-15]|uniref:hypothetical protein n=1 Tax=Hyphomicrobium sp. LHD-15 TaxID=3072142 RepID=UPI00280C7DBE|nr:hypothetical protein [Hyphomicrobium sp. LHD-15]MDQ8698211.1 hypothetical protein [Hyphomicrobium sp. LHD-15]